MPELIIDDPDRSDVGDAADTRRSSRAGQWRQCELFEVVLTATWQGVPVRILESGPSGARVLLLIDEAARAEELGATVVEPGVFEATAAVDDLVDRHGVTNELAPPGRA